MPHDLALSSTLFDSNYPCLELIFMVPKVFEPLKLDCSLESHPYGALVQLIHVCMLVPVCGCTLKEIIGQTD